MIVAFLHQRCMPLGAMRAGCKTGQFDNQLLMYPMLLVVYQGTVSILQNIF
jgi:hypothetical protein